MTPRIQPPRHAHRAFSRVEMLATIAALSLIAAVVVAGCSKDQSQAHATACIDNLQQLQKAFESFAGSTGEFPLFVNPKKLHASHETGWVETLVRAGGLPDPSKGPMNSIKPWVCPAARIPSDWPESWEFMSYGYNAFGDGDAAQPRGAGGRRTEPGSGLTPVRRSMVETPSEFILVGDSVAGSPFGLVEGTGFLAKHMDLPVSDNYATNAASRHAGNANIGFADGHVSPVRLSSLFATNSPIAGLQWNRKEL